MDPSALPALLIPAAAVLLVRALLAARGASQSAADVAVAATAGVAIPAALLLAGIRPAFPLGPVEDGWQWLVWIVPAAALLGIVAASALPRGVRGGASAVGSGMAAALLLSPLRAFGVWPIGAMIIGWGVAAWPRDEERRRSLSASVATAVMVAPMILVRGAHSFALAAVAAAVGAALLAAAFGRRRLLAPFPRALAGVLAAGWGGTLLAAHAYGRTGDSDGFPTVSALALGAAAVVGTAVPPRWGRVVAPLSAAGAALALATVSAWTSGAFDRYEVWW